jgi:AraC-like DNA-binding protein
MTSGSTRIYFNTDVLPERDRFPAFNEEIIRRYTGLDVRTGDPLEFHGSVEFWKAGDVKIGCNISSAIDSARTTNLIRDGDDDLLVNLLVSGQAIQTQRTEHQKLGPGDAIICDCAYPGDLNFFTGVKFWNLKFPRYRIANSLSCSDKFAGMKLNADPIARRLLFEYVAAATAADLPAEGATAELFGQHIVDLVALALGAEGETRRIAQERGARAARRRAILNEIGCRSGDPDLSAATIAMQIGVTPRYIHLLLEETGKSFTHHVLERRLDRAAALLRDTNWHSHKIADIAAEAGFTDLSYFNRAFRSHFGATPSDIRAAAQRCPAVPVA